VVSAQQSSSTNYKVNEVFFGVGGELNACSTSYCSKQAAGETTAGNAASTNYQTQAGFNTSDTPVLEVAVNGGAYDLGVLDAATTHATSATFTVRNYLSTGYVVRLTGTAPTYTSGLGTHTLTALAAQTFSSTGVEQFGANVVANTAPTIGINPQQVPDNTFGFGAAASGYEVPNAFKFVDNDIIAFSPKSSGTTLYTLSMMANISNQTPAGLYTGHFNVVVVSTF
jgi:hypothetical protein